MNFLDTIDMTEACVFLLGIGLIMLRLISDFFRRDYSERRGN